MPGGKRKTDVKLGVNDSPNKKGVRLGQGNADASFFVVKQESEEIQDVKLEWKKRKGDEDLSPEESKAKRIKVSEEEDKVVKQEVNEQAEGVEDYLSDGDVVILDELSKRKANGSPETNSPRKEKILKTNHEGVGEGKGKQSEAAQEQDISAKPVNKAKQVEGYYSNDDVTTLLDALLKRNGFERIRGGDHQDVVRNVQDGVNTRTMVLAPTAEGSEEAIAGLVKDITRANNHNIEQILVPINIPDIHWYTIQIFILQSPEGYFLDARIHDSLGIRKGSVIVEKLAASGIVINSHTEGDLPKIQLGASGAKNVYCGGYTTRLIANLAVNSRILGEEAWGCPNNVDHILRQEDASLVNKHNPAGAGNFGRRAVAVQRMLDTAHYMSAIRSSIACEKERTLLHALKEIYESMPIEMKIRINSLNIPKNPVELSALVRDLYASLPLLKTLFQTNAQGEVEKDAEGILKLDTNIEIDHIRRIMVEFQRKCFQLERVRIAVSQDDAAKPIGQEMVLADSHHNVVENPTTLPYYSSSDDSDARLMGKESEALLKARFSGIKIGSIHADLPMLLASSSILESMTDNECNIERQHQRALEQEETERLHLEKEQNLIASHDIESRKEMLMYYDGELNSVVPATTKLNTQYLEKAVVEGASANNPRDDAYVDKFNSVFDDYEWHAHNVDKENRPNHESGNGASKPDDQDCWPDDLERVETIMSGLITIGYLEECTLLQHLAWLDFKFISEELLLVLLENNKIELWRTIRDFSRGGIKGLAMTHEVQCKAVSYAKNNSRVSQYIPKLLTNMLEVLNNFLPGVTKKYDENWAKAKAYAPIVEALLEHITNRGAPIPKNEDLAVLNVKLGMFYEIIVEDAKKSLHYKEKALEINSGLYEYNHPNVIEALKSASSAHHKLGNVRQAIARLETAFVAEESIYGKVHTVMVDTLDSIGTLYIALLDITKAMACFNNGLEIRDALYKDTPSDIAKSLVAKSLNNLWLAHKELGRPKKSLDGFYKQSLIKIQGLYPGNHHEVARFLNNMGVVYKELGQTKNSLDYMERSLRMRQVLYPDNHPDVATSLSNVGDAYSKLKQTKKAIDYYERALIMRLALYPSNHFDVAASLNCYEEAIKMIEDLYQGNYNYVVESLNNVGYAYQKLGDYMKAIDCFEQALKARQAIYKVDHPEIVQSLHNIGDAYCHLGDYRKALDYYEPALKMRQVIYKGDHPEIAQSLHNIGDAYCHLGDCRKALDYYEPALKMRQSIYKASHSEVAQSLHGMGYAYQKLGDYSKARDYYELALKIRQSFYKGDHPDVAQSLHNMGYVCQKLGDYSKALNYYELAFNMRQAFYKGAHPDVAQSLHNMGSAYQELEDYSNARDYYELALKMRQAFYKCDHPDVAQSLHSMGSAYQELGDYSKAINYYELAFKMRRDFYKCDHPDVAQSLHNMGSAYQELGDYSKALDCYEPALKMRQVLYKGDHPDVEKSLNNVGYAYQKLEDYNKALDCYRPALKMRQALYKGDNPDTVELLNNMGDAYKNLGDNRNAIRYYGASLKMMQALKSNRHDIADSMDKMGYAHHELENYRKALDYFETALNIRQALYKGGHHKVACSLHNVGLAYHELRNYRKALDYLEPALKMMQVLYKRDHPDVARSLNNMGDAYSKVGDHRQAKECFDRANMMGKAIEDGAQRSQKYKEFKGQGTLCIAVDSRFEYYNTGIDQILGLRLGRIGYNAKAVVLRSRYFEKAMGPIVWKLAYDVSVLLSSDNTQIVLVPANLYNEHWLGLLFRDLGGVVEVTYMDSEQVAIVPELRDGLKRGFAINGYDIRFSEIRLEQQRYNNCGSELLENFAYYMTGSRATQEGAIYVHSLLVENSLLDAHEYGLRIEENNKLIRFLSNTALLPIRSIDAFPSSNNIVTHLSHVMEKDGLPRSQGVPRNVEVQINLLPAIKQFNRLLGKWLQDKLRKANAMLHKTTIGFKGLDFGVDSARLLHKPDPENAKRVALDASYLYSLYSGVNGYSAIVSGAEVAYQLHLGEYRKAFNTGASTLSTMALPYILAMGNRPYLGFAYVMWVAASTTYNSVMNLYSFALELSKAEATLESAVSYKELVEWLAASPLQAVYDFGRHATDYKLQINDMLFEKEKTLVKAQLQGEFGQKVFDYVYLPALTENYALMKNLIRGALTEDGVKALQAKQVTITHGSLQYDLCLEAKDLYSVENGSEHYYCYNLEDQILDKVAVTGGISFEVIERL